MSARMSASREGESLTPVEHMIQRRVLMSYANGCARCRARARVIRDRQGSSASNGEIMRTGKVVERCMESPKKVSSTGGVCPLTQKCAQTVEDVRE